MKAIFTQQAREEQDAPIDGQAISMEIEDFKDHFHYSILVETPEESFNYDLAYLVNGEELKQYFLKTN